MDENDKKRQENDMAEQIAYEIFYSNRKTLAVQIRADGSVVVRAPKRMAKYKIEAFLREKREWILTHRKKALEAVEKKQENRLNDEEQKAAILNFLDN